MECRPSLLAGSGDRAATFLKLQIEPVPPHLSRAQVSSRALERCLALLLFVLWHHTLQQVAAHPDSVKYGLSRRSSLQLTFQAEAAALQKLKAALYIHNLSWPEARDPCGSWEGIRCANGHVQSIQLTGLRRARVVGLKTPANALYSLQSLPYLTILNVSSFQVPGELPGWFGNLTHLQKLDFTSSGLNGSLPDSLGNLFSLSVLWLPLNQLFGSIPPSFARLSNLTSFNVSRNRLAGQLPPALQNLTRLQVLDISGNNLTGSLAEKIGSHQEALQKLVLRDNYFTGSIPSSLGELPSLDTLDLSHNNFSGEIPPAIGSLMNLTTLILSNNSLNGSIPSNITGLQNLVTLEASFNGLSGNLPEGIGDLQQLALLHLSHNSLLGYLPTELAGLHRLVSLDISNNFFEGPLPVGLLLNASVGSNCLVNASSQHDLEICSGFYSGQGLPFFGFTPLTPLQAPEALPPVLRGPQVTTPIQTKMDNRRPSRLIPAVVGSGGGLLLVIVVICLLLCYLRSSRKEDTSKPESYVFDDDEIRGIQSPVDLAQARLGEPFTYARLEQATKKFVAANLILEGHSGDLYKGLLEEGVEIVVKRVDTTKFKKSLYATELDVLCKTSHPRIMSLLGYCLDQENVKLLVYRYMPHGDLASSLHRKCSLGSEGDSPCSLDWIKRLKIAIGAAEGLTYLHECFPPTVHRDISTTSILLDDKYEVRIGSLSEARTQDGDAHPSIISRLLGLSLDRSADHGDQGLSYASTAQDVYNFGKVLLELVSGQIGISSSTDLRADAWLEWALPLIDFHDKELLLKLVDPTLLVDEDLLEEVWGVAIIAKLCLNVRPSKRPGMRHILRALENPHKVAREANFRESITLRTSSHSSWNEALFGSWRSNFPSQNFGALPGSLREEYAGKSIPFPHSRRYSSEIVPEPAKEGAYQLPLGETTVVV